MKQYVEKEKKKMEMRGIPKKAIMEYACEIIEGE